MPPLVALLTDFGLRDHYVGAMKGVVLAACPEATLVDVGHEVAAHDVMEGALTLAAVVTAFPAGTVFLAVVDPGVGSGRRGLAAEAGGYRFVGPDNGLLSLALSERERPRVHALTNAGLFRHEVSPVFHGRDVFAPVAGLLARGLPLEDVGPAVMDPVTLAVPALEHPRPGDWRAVVLHVDRFGNLTTNLRKAELEAISASVPEGEAGLLVELEDSVIPLARTYSDVAVGQPLALIGSSGRLEIAVHRGSAARVLGAGEGAVVRLRRAVAAAAEDDL